MGLLQVYLVATFIEHINSQRTSTPQPNEREYNQERACYYRRLMISKPKKSSKQFPKGLKQEAL